MSGGSAEPRLLGIIRHRCCAGFPWLQEAGGYDRDQALQVDDKSALDYAAGQDQPPEEEEEGGDKEGPDKQRQQQQQQAGGQEEQQEGEGGEEEDMEQVGLGQDVYFVVQSSASSLVELGLLHSVA